MLAIKYSCFIAVIFVHSIAVSAHESDTSMSLNAPRQIITPPANVSQNLFTNSKYNHLKRLYSLGLHEEARSEAISYLQLYPIDVDVRFLLGTFYYHAKDYLRAQEELIRVLQETPHYSDANLILIHIEMSNGQYQKALSIANEGLIFEPLNSELLKAKAHTQMAINSVQIPYMLGHEKTVATHHDNSKSKSAHDVKKINTNHVYGHIETAKNKKNTSENEEKKYLNEVGINQQNYYISDVNSVWDYSTLYYGRETSLGKIYGKINYANRLGYDAIQGEIEAYPKINKYVYLDIDYAFANEPNLFPNKSYAIEAYVTTEKAFDFSIGGKYNAVDQTHQFSVFTGSLSKYLDNYKNIVTFRPYFFVPGKGPNSTLYTLNIRHIITDPYFYFGCNVGAGTSPDLADLTTVNFLVTQNKIINPYINFPLYNDRLSVKLSFLFQNQLFPSLNKVRNWSGGTMNLAWKF